MPTTRPLVLAFVAGVACALLAPVLVEGVSERAEAPFPRAAPALMGQPARGHLQQRR